MKLLLMTAFALSLAMPAISNACETKPETKTDTKKLRKIYCECWEDDRGEWKWAAEVTFTAEAKKAESVGTKKCRAKIVDPERAANVYAKQCLFVD